MTLKDKVLDLMDEILPAVFAKVAVVPCPLTDTSEVEKN